MSNTELLLCPSMDWEMVRLNGGPPCFETGVDGDPNRFCARAERWEGHGSSHHEYVSLETYLVSEQVKEVLRRAVRDGERLSADPYRDALRALWEVTTAYVTISTPAPTHMLKDALTAAEKLLADTPDKPVIR